VGLVVDQEAVEEFKSTVTDKSDPQLDALAATYSEQLRHQSSLRLIYCNDTERDLYRGRTQSRTHPQPAGPNRRHQRGRQR
jgi:hypothetical protein